jgi:hypothetical protein
MTRGRKRTNLFDEESVIPDYLAGATLLTAP